MKPLKVVQNAGVLYILTLKCASRYSGVQFFHIATSKNCPRMLCFVHFDLQMCFSLQRRAIFPHLNFKKRFWGVLYILTSKCASRYSGVQFFHIATSKTGPRMLCFVHFDLEMCFSLQRRAIFPHRNFKKWSENAVFCTFWLGNVLLATAACNFSTSQLQKVVRTCSERHILIENVLLATAACNFSFLRSTATSAPAASPRLLFDPAHPQIIEKHSISRRP